MCAHLTAHAPKLEQRIRDWNHIVGSLLFPPLPGSSKDAEQTTLYATSHLFVFGDLNFRLALPPGHALADPTPGVDVSRVLDAENVREELKAFDQLIIERDERRRAFLGLREGEFWRFKCSYKYLLGEVDKYEWVLVRFDHCGGR